MKSRCRVRLSIDYKVQNGDRTNKAVGNPYSPLSSQRLLVQTKIYLQVPMKFLWSLGKLRLHADLYIVYARFIFLWVYNLMITRNYGENKLIICFQPKKIFSVIFTSNENFKYNPPLQLINCWINKPDRKLDQSQLIRRLKLLKRLTGKLLFYAFLK